MTTMNEPTDDDEDASGIDRLLRLRREVEEFETYLEAYAAHLMQLDIDEALGGNDDNDE